MLRRLVRKKVSVRTESPHTNEVKDEMYHILAEVEFRASINAMLKDWLSDLRPGPQIAVQCL